MARARTTADIIVNALRRVGELSSSDYATQAADYVDQLHNTIITGGSEFETEIDEPWLWARSRHPLVIELQPYYTTGTITLTQDATSGIFSAAPTSSLEGWHLFLTSNTNPEVYRIAQHTASSTAFALDAAFTGTTAAGLTYRAIKLDYDLVPDFITVDSENDKVDFISRTTTEQTGTLTHGSYSPSAFATHVASVITAQDANTNTYTGSYDSNRGFFSFVSALNGTATATFQAQNGGTNFYRSAWSTLGFDSTATANNATHTSTYPFASVTRLVSAGRIYYGNTAGQVEGMDTVAFDRDFPLAQLQGGVPTNFCPVREKPDGRKVIRISHYPDRRMRLEFEVIYQPRDLLNSAYSIPLLPKRFVRLLEYGAAYFLSQDKEDSKRQEFYGLAKQTLLSMMKVNRKELQRIGKLYGAVIARADLLSARPSRWDQYGYDYPWWRY